MFRNEEITIEMGDDRPSRPRNSCVLPDSFTERSSNHPIQIVPAAQEAIITIYTMMDEISYTV